MRIVWGIALGLGLGLLLSAQTGLARSDKAHHQAASQTHRRAHAQNRTAVASRHHRVTSHRHPPKPEPLASKPLIVIDPGHGGPDPGAIGLSGTREKNLTLAAALDLRSVLQATGRYRIALTRTGDQSVSLAGRLAFAHSHDADLLIAIHADASRDRRARGASVYVRSGDAAAPLTASAGLQDSMIDQLSDDVHMAGAPARTAHLYVLASRTIPSVLVEMGFLSNRQDEALLRQAAHRRVVVQAIKDAVDDYFAALRKGASRT